MFNPDPIQKAESFIKETHDAVGKYTQPTLKKYPLLFAFFLTFSIASILHGFDLITDETPILHDHPILLILIGTVALFLTGTLYKLLEKHRS